MTSFKDQDWETRYLSMGDQAEKEFEGRHVEWDRFGWSRPNISMGKLSINMRYMPDYAMFTPSGTNVLIEVQGCGQDQYFKFKDEKLVALRWWQAISEMRVYFWLWDAANGRSFMVHIDDLQTMARYPEAHAGVRDMFPEGKAYVKFPVETFLKVGLKGGA